MIHYLLIAGVAFAFSACFSNDGQETDASGLDSDSGSGRDIIYPDTINPDISEDSEEKDTFIGRDIIRRDELSDEHITELDIPEELDISADGDVESEDVLRDADIAVDGDVTNEDIFQDIDVCSDEGIEDISSDIDVFTGEDVLGEISDDCVNDLDVFQDGLVYTGFPANCLPKDIKLSKNQYGEDFLLGSCVQPTANRLFKCDFDADVRSLECSFLNENIPELPFNPKSLSGNVLIPKHLSNSDDLIYTVLCYEQSYELWTDKSPYCYNVVSSLVDGSEIYANAGFKLTIIGDDDVIYPKIDLVTPFISSSGNPSRIMFVADRLNPSNENGSYDVVLGKVNPDGSWRNSVPVGSMEHKPVSIGQVDDYLVVLGSDSKGSEICFLPEVESAQNSLHCMENSVTGLMSSKDIIVGNVNGLTGDRILSLYDDGINLSLKAISIPEEFVPQEPDPVVNFDDKPLNDCGLGNVNHISYSGGTVYIANDYSIVSQVIASSNTADKVFETTEGSIENIIAYSNGQVEGSFAVLNANGISKLYWIPNSKFDSCVSE